MKLGKSVKMKKIISKISLFTQKGGQLTGVLLAFVFMFIASSLISPYFLTGYNLTIMSRELAFVGIVAIAQGLLLLMGYIDISIGSIAGLSGVLTAKALSEYGLNPLVAVLIGLTAGAICGVVNGFLITTFNLNPLVLTIGTSTVFVGINLLITKGRTITGLPEITTLIGGGSVFSIPIPNFFMIGVFLIALFLTTRTVFGRNVYAIGDSIEAAKLVGIKINKIIIITYASSSVFASLAGILMVFRLISAQTTVGQTWLLPSIAAPVIGGIATTGGVGSIAGALVGAAILVLIGNIVILGGVNVYWQQIINGAVIISAIIMDALIRKYSKSI
ncbi:Fructose import permease protein FrcC [subsurface metagenome]